MFYRKRLTNMLRRMRLSAAVLLGLWVFSASAQALELIVNNSVAIDEISVRELRAIYTMKRDRWPDSSSMTVYVLTADNRTHIEFCKKILRLFPHQLQTGWDRLVYSGRGKAPVEVTSEQEMLNIIAATPGAVGYVSDLPAGQGVKILRITK